MNRLISFDFGGTLAQRTFTRNAGWEFIYPDTVTAIKKLTLDDLGMHFAIATNGDTRHANELLEKQRLSHIFMVDDATKSLVLGAGAEATYTERREIPLKQSFTDKLRGLPVRTEVQMVPVTRELRSKPHPDMLHYAMQLCDIQDPRKVVHIGDSFEDARMAEYAGAHFIGVSPITEVSYMSMTALLTHAIRLLQQ